MYNQIVKQSKQNTIAIDFDGVMHDDYDGWGDGTLYGDLIVETISSIRYLSKKYKIIIFTAKARKDRPLVNGKTGVQLIWQFLEKHNIKDCILDVTAQKPHALMYIDDKGIRFTNWKDTIKLIQDMYEPFKM